MLLSLREKKKSSLFEIILTWNILCKNGSRINFLRVCKDTILDFMSSGNDSRGLYIFREINRTTSFYSINSSFFFFYKWVPSDSLIFTFTSNQSLQAKILADMDSASV